MIKEFSKESSYENKTFSGITIEDEELKSKEFTNCTFTKVTILSSTFKSCIFVDCIFENCHISALKVTDSRFSNVNFVSSKVQGIDWTAASKFNLELSFSKSNIDYSVFNGLKLKNFRLINSYAKEAYFLDSDLSKADCSGTDFEGSQFLRTNLSNASFSHAKNYFINPKLNTLKKTKFTLPEVLNIIEECGIEIENF